MTSSIYANAYKQYLAEAKAAVQFHDPNWSEAALTRERYKRLSDARARLKDATDALIATQGGDPETARAAAFEQLAVTDANSAAVASNEWAKVRALLEAGRNLAQIIRNADQRRLSAILDHLDSDIALMSDDPDAASAEVADEVLSRFAALGNEKATAAVAAQSASVHTAAWRQVVDESTRGGEVSVATQSALYRANADDYELAFSDEVNAAEVRTAITKLDGIGPNLAAEVSNGSAS